MNYQTTSSDKKLGKGPADMPDRGKSNPKEQTTSARVPLGRKETPVANLGVKAGMGEVQCTSEKSNLGRGAISPYEPLNATKPQVPFGGRKRK